MVMLFKESNHQCRCIFIHVPKVAGISIESALLSDKAGHHTAFEYFQENEQLFNDYYKFSFVRNPYQRLASAFHYLKLGGRNEFDKKWSIENLSKMKSLKDFVMALKDSDYKKKVFNWIHFRPQYQFVCDASGEVIVDFIGKFEELENDFSKVCSALGREAVLGRENITKKNHEYDEEYDNDMRRIVYSLYEKDFKLFEYELGIQ